MEENNLDKYFQEKLASHSEEPSPAVWDNIAAETSKGGFVWSRKLLLLLLLLLTIGGSAIVGYSLMEMEERVTQIEEQLNAEEEALETKEKSELTKENVTDADEVQDKNNQSETAELREVSTLESSERGALTNGQGETETGSVEAPSMNQNKAAVVAGFITSTSNEASGRETSSQNIPTEESPGSSHPPATNEAAPFVATSPEELIAPIDFQQIPTIEARLFNAQTPLIISKKREVDYFNTRPVWELFVYGMANYTHRRVVATAEGAEAIPNQLDKVENGLIRPGGGLQLSRELGSSFRLSLGVEYNQWVQEATNEVEVPVEEVNIIATSGSPVFSFDGEVTNSLGNQIFSSNSSENPFPNDGLGFTESGSIAIEVQSTQTINYLSLPVTLDYVIDSYPWRFFAGGGFSVNQIIGSKTEYQINPETEGFEIAEAESVNGTYLAFHAGFGVDYMLSERLSFRLNPSYRGWMNPIFENEEYRTLPFGVAVRGGLVYRLSR